MGRGRIEVAVQQGKIGGTTPTLALPLNPDKPKVFEQVHDVMGTARLS